MAISRMIRNQIDIPWVTGGKLVKNNKMKLIMKAIGIKNIEGLLEMSQKCA